MFLIDMFLIKKAVFLEIRRQIEIVETECEKQIFALVVILHYVSEIRQCKST